MGWLLCFQYVYNVLLAGNLDKAAEGFGRLPEPQDAAWTPVPGQVQRMLACADIALAVTLTRFPGPARTALPRPDRRPPR
jgi:hypothetical protein